MLARPARDSKLYSIAQALSAGTARADRPMPYGKLLAGASDDALTAQGEA